MAAFIANFEGEVRVDLFTETYVVGQAFAVDKDASSALVQGKIRVISSR